MPVAPTELQLLRFQEGLCLTCPEFLLAVPVNVLSKEGGSFFLLSKDFTSKSAFYRPFV